MSCCDTKDFCVKSGETFHPTVRWSTDQLLSAAITAITLGAPVQITVPGHGVPDGWLVAVTGVQGMVQINACRYPPAGRDWQRASVVDANTLSLNDVSSADWTAYLSGGFLIHNAPAVLSGAAFALNVWDTPDRSDTPLVTLTDSGGGITVDPVGMTITPLLQTAGLTWTTGYYALTATLAGVVTELLSGALNIET